MAKAVIIDDEPNLVKFVGQNLRARGYDVADATNGLDGVELVRRFKPDLIILDLNMPGMDGFEVCSYVRHFTDAPIIMLTASGNEGDKIHALDLGADDYLTKPFGVGELMARVRAVTRRADRALEHPRRESMVRSGELEFDFDHRRVTRAGEPVKLTPLEYAMLEELVNHPDVVVGHRQLLSAVWGAEYRDETEYLRVYMGRLRRKLESDPVNPRHFQTEPGVGYRFTPQAVEAVA
ncbi:MAG: response regulator transcription factor [Chloroflexi bacterium]|nr:response regulator transcription factor [Chloroflexota bacterium]